MTEETVRKVQEFLYNEDNIKNCSECPMNFGMEEGSSRIAGPCGQQNCWVEIHCND